ncbi:MAG: nucleotidyl transferase AbiEii/AbiGii toxin family protein [Anaerolineae bacterium]
MKDYLASLVRAATTLAQGRSIAREYLQARILVGLQHSGAMIPLAFHGGTALRFLYSLPRYSEDLDFALERSHERYELRTWLQGVRNELAAEGYAVDIALNDAHTVHCAWLRFRSLYFELGLAPQQSETLTIKLEVNTQPPAGAQLATTVVRRYVILNLQHHDQASLLAGKMHVLLQREYFKGRDLYDLLWYLSDPRWPAPNLTMLNHALAQTGWSGATPTSGTWREVVRARLRTVDWAQIQADVRPFLETPVDAALLTRANLERLLTASSELFT